MAVYCDLTLDLSFRKEMHNFCIWWSFWLGKPPWFPLCSGKMNGPICLSYYFCYIQREGSPSCQLRLFTPLPLTRVSSQCSRLSWEWRGGGTALRWHKKPSPQLTNKEQQIFLMYSGLESSPWGENQHQRTGWTRSFHLDTRILF